jgi:DNA invertase Pin-like site-specific DNA recombinase
LNKFTLGLIRVSTTAQNPAMQIVRLEKEAQERGLRTISYEDYESSKVKPQDPLLVMVEDRRSGKNVKDRKGMVWAKGQIDAGHVDLILVQRVDRIGRGMIDNYEFAKSCRETKTRLQGLMDNINLDTPSGRLMYNTLSSNAEYMREIIVENTKEGLLTRYNTCLLCGLHKDRHDKRTSCPFQHTPHSGGMKGRISHHVWSLLPKLWELEDHKFSHRHMRKLTGLNGRTIRTYLARRAELQPTWKRR